MQAWLPFMRLSCLETWSVWSCWSSTEQTSTREMRRGGPHCTWPAVTASHTSQSEHLVFIICNTAELLLKSCCHKFEWQYSLKAKCCWSTIQPEHWVFVNLKMKETDVQLSIYLCGHCMFTLEKHIPTNTYGQTVIGPTALARHRGKISWRSCWILAPHWPSWHWHSQSGKAATSDTFHWAGLYCFPSATCSRSVLTQSWRTTAGRSRPTSSTQTARSCWSSSAWLSMTENTWLLKSHTHARLSNLLSSNGQKKGYVSAVPWFCELPRLRSSVTVDVCWVEVDRAHCQLPPDWSWNHADGRSPLISDFDLKLLIAFGEWLDVVATVCCETWSCCFCSAN